MINSDNQILHGPVWKALIFFFIPCWMGMVFQQLYNTVDTIIVGHFVGTGAVAAVGNVGIAVQVVVGVCVAFANGAGVVLAQHYGASEFDKVKTDIRCALVLALVGGLVFTILCVNVAHMVPAWLDTPEDIYADSVTYLKVYFMALIPNLIYNFGTALLRGMGDSKRPLYILVATSIANIVLDLVFVLKLGWGVLGVAVATDLSQVLSAVLVIWLLLRQMPGLFEKWDLNAQTYIDIFKIGGPTALQSLMYSGSNFLIQEAVNDFGTPVIAAWSIYGKADCLIWMTMNSMGLAVTSFAGQNFGAGQYERVKKGAWEASAMLGAALVAFIILFYVGAEFIFGIFTGDAQVIALGAAQMRFLLPAYLLFFLVELLPAALRGCGDVLVPTIASIIGICLIRVIWLKYVLPYYHTMNCLMTSYIITWGITELFYIIYFTKGKWMQRCIAKKQYS